MKQKFFLKSLFILFLFKGLITMGQAVLKTQDFETGTSNWGYTSTPSSYEDLTTSTNPSVWGLVEKLENQLFSSRKIIPTTLPVDNISFWGISNYNTTHDKHTLVFDDVDLTTHSGYKLLTFYYNTEYTSRNSVTVPVSFDGVFKGGTVLSPTFSSSPKPGWNKFEYYIPNTVSNFGVSINCARGINQSSYMAGFDNFKIEQTNFIDVENRSTKTERNISYDVTFPVNFTGYLNSPDATLKITANITDSFNTAEAEDFTIKTPSLNFTSSSEAKDLIIAINPDEDFEDELIILDLELTSKDGTVRKFREAIRVEDTDHPVLLSEVYTNPDNANGDANGDGVIDSLNDQFIELYNPNDYAVDISGFELEVGKILTDETNYTFSKYHTFPSGTVIPANEIIVVFGGGTPTNISGIVQIANENKLDLNDTGTTKGFLSIKGSFYESSRRVFANDLVYDRLSGVSTAVYRKYDAAGNIRFKDFVDHTTIVSNPVLFSPGKNNQENPLAYRWTGSTSNDWHTASNWLNNTVPPANVDVEIASKLSNYPTVNAPITVKSLLLGDNTSLIANASITGPVTYSKGFLTDNWYLAASPVFRQSVRPLVDLVPFASSSFDGNRGLASYTSSRSTWWYFSRFKGFNSYFESGQGYAFKFSRANVLVPFKGTINSGNVTKLVNVFGSSSFNLLGNPFTAYVNSKTLLTENTGLLSEETVWLWNGTQYVTYNKINPIEIAPAQGFFVKAATRGDFIFKTTNQSHQSTSTFMRQVPKSNFELFVKEGSNKKSTKVFFIDNKTTGFDNGYDSSMFNDTASNFEIFTGLVSNDERKKLAIQTLPKLNYNEIIIPVGLIAEADKEVEFSVNTQNLPEDLEVYLEDRLNHQFINLSKENYAITLKNKAEGVGQFYIHTTHKKLSNEDILKNRNSISIFKSGKREITISGLKDKANIGVYSILGEELMNTQVTSKGANKIGLLSFSAGIYIVKLHSELGVISKKIILE